MHQLAQEAGCGAQVGEGLVSGKRHVLPPFCCCLQAEAAEAMELVTAVGATVEQEEEDEQPEEAAAAEPELDAEQAPAAAPAVQSFALDMEEDEDEGEEDEPEFETQVQLGLNCRQGRQVLQQGAASGPPALASTQ